MLLTVSTFCDAVTRGMNGLIARLEKDTSRFMTDREKKELAESYRAVSRMLTAAMDVNPSVAGATISTTDAVLEYHLPKASAWCDLVLVGEGASSPEVIIIELISSGARCSGLVYFTQDVDLTPYRVGPNATLCRDYPVYNTTESSTGALAAYVADTIKGPDNAFAKRFILGDYKQDRNILRQVADSLATLKGQAVRNPFVLLDNQDLGFSKVLSIVDALPEEGKEVIIVSGPPGSGKSAVAANLWVECARRFAGRGNILFVTTSSSQYDPWAHTFETSTGNRGARGMVVKANSFNPGMSGTLVKDVLQPYFAAKDRSRYLETSSPTVCSSSDSTAITSTMPPVPGSSPRRRIRSISPSSTRRTHSSTRPHPISGRTRVPAGATRPARRPITSSASTGCRSS